MRGEGKEVREALHVLAGDLLGEGKVGGKGWEGVGMVEAGRGDEVVVK